MKTTDLAVLAAASFAIYRISVQPNSSAASLRGEYDFKIEPQKAANKKMYRLDDSLFRYLDEPVQTVLLRCFAFDYTSPRMITDTKLYRLAVSASNKTGAPCAWVQIVALKNPRLDLVKAAENMLRYCDSFIGKSSGKEIDLVKLREEAINRGLLS